MIRSLGRVVGSAAGEVPALVGQLLRDHEPSRESDPSQADKDREFELLLQSITSSRLYAFLSRPVLWVAASWNRSRTHDLVSRVHRQLATFDVAQLFHLAGVMLLAAVVTDGLLQQFDPRPASAIRVWLWCALLVIATVVRAKAPQLAVAWRRRFNQ